MSDSVIDPLNLVGSEPSRGVTRTFEKAQADDHSPDNTGTTTTLPPSQSVNGEIEVAGDSDWFAVDVESGQTYRFDLTGETLTDVTFELRGAVGQLFNIGDNNSDDTTSSITFEFFITGTVYLVVSTDGAETGSYSVSAVNTADLVIPGITVDEGDLDAGNSIAAATDTLISGDTFSGTLSSASDQDFVAVDVTAGTQYTFDLQGAGAGNGTLEDGFLVLRDGNNNFIAQDDNSGAGDDAQIVYTAGSSGTVYISARTFGSDGGTYSLVTSPEERTEDDGEGTGSGDGDDGGGGTTIPGVTVSEGDEDSPDSILTDVRLNPGDTFEGELALGSDKDWVRIELTAGTEYTFDLEGEETNAGTLSDPFLVLRNGSGGFVAQDDDSGEKLNSQIVFTPSASGTYYLEARNFEDETGTYTLRTSSSEPNTPDDSDDSGGGSGGTGALVSGITVSEGDIDEGGGTVSSRTTLISGDTFIGEIDRRFDSDYVAINLRAGTQYTFEVEGAATNAGTLTDPNLTLRNIIGDSIVSDGGSGVGLNARIVFTPSESGTYYLSVSGRNRAEGTYTLTTTPDERLDTGRGLSDPPGDIVVDGVAVFEGEDAVGSTSTAYSLIAGDSFRGTLGSASDVDYVKIALAAGTTYGFVVDGFNSGRGDTLRDPIVVLRDANGDFVAQEEAGLFDIAKMEFTPTESGTYYLSVRSDSGFDGIYTLTTSPDRRTSQDPQPDSGSEPLPIIDGVEVEEEGDVPASTETPVLLISGDYLLGDLNSASDRDWYGVQLDAGTRYDFDLQGTLVGAGASGSLDEPYLILRDGNGTFIDQDGIGDGSQFRAELTYTPTVSGTYYLEVRTFGGSGGRYLLETSPEQRTEADSESTSASAQLSVGDTSIQDDLSTLGDAALLPVPDFADDSGIYSLIASGNTGVQTQVVAFEGSAYEGGADVRESGESYVTSADAAGMLAIIDEASFG